MFDTPDRVAKAWIANNVVESVIDVTVSLENAQHGGVCFSKRYAHSPT
jgi:hypothetical protein